MHINGMSELVSNDSDSDDEPEGQKPESFTIRFLAFKACENRIKERKLWLCILGLIWKIPVEILRMMMRLMYYR